MILCRRVDHQGSQLDCLKKIRTANSQKQPLKHAMNSLFEHCFKTISSVYLYTFAYLALYICLVFFSLNYFASNFLRSAVQSPADSTIGCVLSFKVSCFCLATLLQYFLLHHFPRKEWLQLVKAAKNDSSKEARLISCIHDNLSNGLAGSVPFYARLVFSSSSFMLKLNIC